MSNAPNDQADYGQPRWIAGRPPQRERTQYGPNTHKAQDKTTERNASAPARDAARPLVNPVLMSSKT